MSTPPAAALGSYARWARDFALLGALSSGLVPLVTLFGADSLAIPFTAAAVAIGALGGVLVGLLGRRFIGGFGGRLPIGLLLLVGPAIGAAWGAITGASAAYVWWSWRSADWAPAMLMREAAWFAGIAAAVQFGWFWLPYVLGTAHRRGVFGLWLLAGISAGAVGLLFRMTMGG